MVFGLLRKGVILWSTEIIAKAATSVEAFNGGSSMAISTRESVEAYFNKFGSTQKKYQYYANPDFYIGYVRINHKPEFLSVVAMGDNGSVAASFVPDLQHGQDFLGLMGKKAFADQVASMMQQAAHGN